MTSIYPTMIGKGDAEALHEVHTFLLPLNPSDEEIQSYYTASIHGINKIHQPCP